MDLHLSDKDFRTLLYPVMEKGDILKRFPELFETFNFREYKQTCGFLGEPVLDENNIIRYVFLVYDKGSPLQKGSDPLKRKTLAAQYAGFQVSEAGLFEDSVDKIMKCQNRQINSIIVAFVRMFGDTRWATLVSGNEAIYQKMEAMISLGKGKDEKETAAIEKTKGDLFNQIESMSEKLTTTVNKMMGDENPYLRRDLFCAIDEEIRNRLNITPERRAGIE
jgi:hypothetical protein